MQRSECTLKNHVPNIVTSGIVFLENGSYRIVPWDGKGVPDIIAKHSNIVQETFPDTEYPFGIWSKKHFEYRKAAITLEELVSSGGQSSTWPYIITKRCRGKIFAELRDGFSVEEVSSLASFLGEQLRNLHVLPVSPLTDSTNLHMKKKLEIDHENGFMEKLSQKGDLPAKMEVFFAVLNRKKKDVLSRLTKWGYPIPSTLIEKVNEYLPNDFTELRSLFKNENGLLEVRNSCSWIHTDIMDDNIHLEQYCVESSDTRMINSDVNGSSNRPEMSWRLGYIYDFSNMSVGDPILDIIPIHLDIFHGDLQLLKQLLESYGLPFGKRSSSDDGCIIPSHVLLLYHTRGWEDVEKAVWGDLNYHFSI